MEAVEALLDIYHADVNITVGKEDAFKGTRTGDVLEATLQHPRDTCRSLLRILLQRGASLLNPSTGVVSKELLLLVLQRGEDVLDIFAELDPDGFDHAIKKFVWGESLKYKNALTSAIELGLEDTAFKLLAYGAPAKLELNSSSVDAHKQQSFSHHLYGKTALEAAEEDFWQPILCAAHFEMPRLVLELLNRGADAKSRLTDHQARSLIWSSKCRSVLDLVSAKLIELRGWDMEDEFLPRELVGTPEGTIQRDGKKSRVTQMIKLYEEAEARLVSLGAEITDGLNLQGDDSPRPHKRVQLFAPNPEAETEVAIPSHTFTKDIDFEKLETAEDGQRAL